MELLITADGSPTLLNAQGVTYHSRQGAEAESKHVYMQASKLEARLAYGGTLRILEVGLGTGLNFVLAATLAAQYPLASMQYIAYEPNPVPHSLLAAYYQHLPHLQGPWEQVLLQAQPQGQLHNMYWDFRTTAWPDMAMNEQPVDVLFYDAFGPKDAPELWTEAVLTHTLETLAPGGTLVTFSINGDTKRLLKQLGYSFSRPKGFGPKREMLVVMGHQIYN